MGDHAANDICFCQGILYRIGDQHQFVHGKSVAARPQLCSGARVDHRFDDQVGLFGQQIVASSGVQSEPVNFVNDAINVPMDWCVSLWRLVAGFHRRQQIKAVFRF